MAVKKQIKVALGEHLSPVGDLTLNIEGPACAVSFRYHKDWLDQGFALSPRMPLETTTFRYAAKEKCLFFHDSAGEGWGRDLIRVLLGRQAGKADFLLFAGDETRQGALRYLDTWGGGVAAQPAAGPRLERRRRIDALGRGLRERRDSGR